jgi:mannose-6-phosphate isomerase-like protein (cupin superfamily)
MATRTPYSTDSDTGFGPLELITFKPSSMGKNPWYNQTLCRVNDCVVRLGVLDGEFHWHKYDQKDEFFYVVEGRFEIDLEGRTVDLEPRQGFTVPKGRRRADRRLSPALIRR